MQNYWNHALPILLPTRIVLTKTVETLHKTHYFYFTSWFVLYQPLVYRKKGWSKKGLKGKRTMGFSIFQFPSMQSFSALSGWLMQGGDESKRGCERNPWLCFLGRHCFEWKAWLLGAVSTHPSAHSVFVTHCELVLLNFRASRIHRNPVLTGALPTLCEWGGMEWCGHTHWMGALLTRTLPWPVRPHSQTQVQSYSY